MKYDCYWRFPTFRLSVGANEIKAERTNFENAPAKRNHDSHPWNYSLNWLLLLIIRPFKRMQHLRTTIARLRPMAALQTARCASQPVQGGPGERALRTFPSARRLEAPGAAEPFLNGTSSNYVEEMYFAWLENPGNVHKASARASLFEKRNVCV